MSRPDQRLFEADVSSAAFRNGVEKGLWGVAEPEFVPDAVAWPIVYLWMKAAPKDGAPCRYYFRLSAENYPASPPTGTFWDPVAKTMLSFGQFPKGRAGSRFAKVFRTDWEGSARALYHPYDGYAAQTHPEWVRDIPQLRWTEALTIVDWLVEFHTLLISPDYVGL